MRTVYRRHSAASDCLRRGRAADHCQVQGGRHSVSTGFRGTKLIGAEVHNETDQKIGTIDDIIVANRDKVAYAIISVGGFLGVGEKLVAVPFDGLKLAPEKATLSGATKATLENMLNFTYQK